MTVQPPTDSPNVEHLTALLPAQVLDAVRIALHGTPEGRDLEVASAVAVATYTATLDYVLGQLQVSER